MRKPCTPKSWGDDNCPLIRKSLAAANRKLRERVVKVASEQNISSGDKSSFGFLLPANFTTFSGFVDRLLEGLTDAQSAETESGTMQKILWLQHVIGHDHRKRTENTGQYLMTTQLARKAGLRQHVIDKLVIKYQQLVYSTHQYLFEMIPVGAPRTGIPSFHGRCDSTNLRLCTQEMFDNQVCRCIESYEDLGDQLRFAIMNAHNKFQGISFTPFDDFVGAFLNAVRSISILRPFFRAYIAVTS